jgi:hypothetical protein
MSVTLADLSSEANLDRPSASSVTTRRCGMPSSLLPMCRLDFLGEFRQVRALHLRLDIIYMMQKHCFLN